MLKAAGFADESKTYSLRQMERIANSAVQATAATITYLEETYSTVSDNPKKLAVWMDAEKLQFALRRNALRGLEYHWYYQHTWSRRRQYPSINLQPMLRYFVDSVYKGTHGSVCGEVIGSSLGAHVAVEINRLYFALSVLVARLLDGDPEYMGFTMETLVDIEKCTVTLEIVRARYSAPDRFRGALFRYQENEDQTDDDILLSIFCSCFNVQQRCNFSGNKRSIRLIFPLKVQSVTEAPGVYLLHAPRTEPDNGTLGIACTMLSSIAPGAMLFGHF